MNSEARKRQPPSIEEVLAARMTITAAAGVTGTDVFADADDELLIAVTHSTLQVLTDAVEILRRHQEHQ